MPKDPNVVSSWPLACTVNRVGPRDDQPSLRIADDVLDGRSKDGHDALVSERRVELARAEQGTRLEPTRKTGPSASTAIVAGIVGSPCLGLRCDGYVVLGGTLPRHPIWANEET